MSVPLVTYAQNREDLYLFALIGHIESGFYVDVGANHERLHSVTRLFYERGWRGINIDANPKLMAEFVEARPRDTNLNAGVGATEGMLSFRDYPQHDGLSTFDVGIKALHGDTAYPFVDRLVPVRPLASILDDRGVDRIDFLKIDVEGFELEVVAGNDWRRFRPTVVLLEATRGQQLVDVMASHGYRLEFFDGLNFYFVAAEAEGVSIHNYSERVLRANYRTMAEVDLAARWENGAPGPTELGIKGQLVGLRGQFVSLVRVVARRLHRR